MELVFVKNWMVFTPNILSQPSHSSMPNLPTHSVGGLLIIFQLCIHNICCSSDLHPFIYLSRQCISEASHNLHIHPRIFTMMHQLLMIIHYRQIKSGNFPSRFSDFLVGPSIFSQSLSCSPCSQVSKLVSHLTVS